jgi:hypothetical protein
MPRDDVPHAVAFRALTDTAASPRSGTTAPTVPRHAGFPAFRPRWPWLGADLQTLRDTLVPDADRPASAGSKAIEFAMPDGTGDRLHGVLERPRSPRSGLPLAVLVHGLTGCADSRYVRRAAGRLRGAGYRTLRLNLRGAGASRPFSRQQYHSGRSEDLAAVLAQLPADLTADGLVLAGWSLGANLLLKGLAEFGAQFPIRAAVAVSAPIDLAAAAERIRAPRNWPYHRWLLYRMKVEAAAGPLLEGAAETLARIRDIVEFDERLTAPNNGFAGAADYYAKCSAVRFLPAVPVPTLVIHALDDPWIPGAAYRTHDWDANPNLTPLLTAHGGHVGFHAPGGRVWSDDCMLDYLDRVCGGDGQPALRRRATSTAK